jgi:hypothetical protein
LVGVVRGRTAGAARAVALDGRAERTSERQGWRGGEGGIPEQTRRQGQALQPVQEKGKQLNDLKEQPRRTGFELGVEMLSQEPEAMSAFQVGAPDGIGNPVEVRRGAAVRQLGQGIEGQQSMDQEIEQQVACAVGEGSHPLPDGGDIRARMGQPVHQPLPTQTRDQVEGDDVLEQVDYVMAMGMQEVGQQAVGATTGLAPNPLHQDAVVHDAGAGRARVGAPADQATTGLAVWTGVWDGEAATRKRDGFGVLLHRTGKVLYNDHELGTPPSFVVGLGNLETRREVSSFLAGMGTLNRQRATYWRRAIIPVSTSSVKLGCGYDSLLSPVLSLIQCGRSPCGGNWL